MTNRYQNDQLPLPNYDSPHIPPLPYSSNFLQRQFRDETRYNKIPFYNSLRNLASSRSKTQNPIPNQQLSNSRLRDKSIKKETQHRITGQKYPVLNQTLNRSVIMEPKLRSQQIRDKFNVSLLNNQRYAQSIPVNSNSNLIPKQHTQRKYNSFPQPSEIQQKSPIYRPTYKNDQIVPQNDNKYFQYVLQYSFRSKKGSSIHDPNKPNQDVAVTSANLNNQSFLHYFGVCDGHGPFGHLVSSYLKKNLPIALSQVKNNQKNVRNQLMNAFKSVTDKLPKQINADLGVSGSTSVGVYLNQNKLYCCNIGDSRAVLGSQDGVKKWRATALSIDHKPQNSQQANRIIMSKGRIQPIRDENGNHVGPMRVWLKNQDTPGLAMTRSFGDQIASQVGVISFPQIRQFVIGERDKIIIIASDGIWEFLTAEQVINIIAPYYQERNIEEACNALLASAIKLWKDDNSQAIDDITFVLLFLDYSIDSEVYTTR